MSAPISLTTEPRTGSGSRDSRRLRKQGRIPAVVYGHKKPPVHVTVSADALDRAVRVLHARVLDLQVNGQSEKVLIRELQWDHLGSQMIHADFERVDENERVRVTVPVKLKNSPKNTGGGVLDQPLHMIHVECPVIAIPEEITLDVTNLTLGAPVHVSDLVLPEGVKVLEAREMVVVQLKLPGVEAPVVVPAAEGTAEPEVIKKEKKTEEEEE